jgi:hypothetical protein
MQSVRLYHAEDNRLRFVFDDAVVSFRLAANATFEDIARTLAELAPQHYGDPLAIDVTLAAPQDDRVCRRSRRPRFGPHPDQTVLGCGSA